MLRQNRSFSHRLSDGPPRLIPYAHLMVHMRNRAYSPQMGRFMGLWTV